MLTPKNFATTATASDLNFEYVNQSYKVTGLKDPTFEGKLVIPAKYNDQTNGEYNVVEIADNAFKNTNITSLDFESEEYMTILGNYAFQNCAKLKEINIPKKVNSMGYDLFADCINLQKIRYNTSVYTGSSSGSSFPPFRNAGTNVASGIVLILGKDITTVANTFTGYHDMNGPKIGKVELEEGITNLQWDSFSSDSNWLYSNVFSSITLPSTLQTITGSVIGGFNQITNNASLTTAYELPEPYQWTLNGEPVTEIAAGEEGKGVYAREMI